MQSRLPTFLNKYRVCIICEGDEEYDYLERLNAIGVWSNVYNVTLDNACGNGNIPARYQERYQNGSYDIVLIFCDTEKKPYEQYEDIKQKVNEFHGVRNVAEKVVVFGNPCTLQIIVEHWADIKLKKQFAEFYNRLSKTVQNLTDAVNVESEHEAEIYVKKVFGEEFEVPPKQASSARHFWAF